MIWLYDYYSLDDYTIQQGLQFIVMRSQSPPPCMHSFFYTWVFICKMIVK